MARPARFSDDDILDGAARAVRALGPRVTIADIAREIGGPSGSIYHRFASRDELLGHLWVRSIRRFHLGLLAALQIEDPRDAIRRAARHIPEHCRQNPAEARAMLLFSQRRLLESGPESLRDEVEHINDDIDTALMRITGAIPALAPERAREVLTVATRLAPYGITRPFIGGDVPRWLDDAVAAAAIAIADSAVGRGESPSRTG